MQTIDKITAKIKDSLQNVIICEQIATSHAMFFGR